MVDDCDGSYKCSGSMPDRYPISAILQFPSCVCQVSGTSSARWASYLSNPVIVLATSHNVPILWPSVSRPRFPRLLPHTIFTITRRIIWSITGALLMVIAIRNDMSDMSLAISIDAIPRTPIILDARLHLVEAQPRYPLEFPWPARLHSSIPAVGVDGIQPGVTWHCSQG